MGANLKQVTIGGIEEGRFLADIDVALDKLQDNVIEFCDKHGAKAKGAKGKLTVEILIAAITPESGSFAFATQIKQTLPSEPPTVTFAMSAENEAGKLRLFSRPTGTGKDAPEQKILCTASGDAVDVKTGKAAPKQSASQ